MPSAYNKNGQKKPHDVQSMGSKLQYCVHVFVLYCLKSRIALTNNQNFEF